MRPELVRARQLLNEAAAKVEAQPHLARAIAADAVTVLGRYRTDRPDLTATGPADTGTSVPREWRLDYANRHARRKEQHGHVVS